MRQAAFTPQQNGVYRIPSNPVPGGMPEGFFIRQLNLSAHPEKADLMAYLAQELGFPEHFGANWDALVDCLCDMEWAPANGYILTLTGLAEHPEADTLWDVMAACGEHWQTLYKPFFVFGDLEDLPVFN